MTKRLLVAVIAGIVIGLLIARWSTVNTTIPDPNSMHIQASSSRLHGSYILVGTRK